MSQQLTLALGFALKEQGLDQLEVSHEGFLAHVRAIARELAIRNGGIISIDEVRDQAESQGVRPESPKAWGGVFRQPEWEFVGYKRTRRATSHARTICLWRLKTMPIQGDSHEN